MPQIEVTFDIDANGILNVSAKDKGTGKMQQIRIEASSGLTDDEIKRMKAEAEANRDADMKAKEQADKVNNADAMIFQTEKQLKEYGDKIPADKKVNIESALKELKDAMASKDLARIDAANTKLNEAWQAASQEMYQAQQQAGANPGAGAGAGANAGAGAGTNAGAGAGANAGAGQNGSTVTDVPFEEVK